jgi:cytoskeleton protein RodZ
MNEAFQPGFGARLKAGREARNLAIADVAAKLKLTTRQIEAIEAEDLAHLPNEVFVRGFVRNYARLLDLDAGELIAPVDAQTAVAETITAPSAGVIFATRGIRRWLLTPLLGLLTFLLLVAALYYWLRQGEDALVVEPVAPAGVSAPVAEVLPLQLPATAEGAMPDGSAAMPAPAAETPVPPVASPPPAAPPPAAPPPAAPAEPAVRTAPGANVLRFEPALDAWVQVVDGRGNRFSKLVRAGSVESFAGEPPFRLVVGEAARVRMTYNGHDIDLTPFIGQKVARLTLE